ncbi:hypothetical protein IAD21_01987 [Abditibacteriota bacterium]|nr:hypothetical protein IAD21_01987 [Abditibacteriota bacterium]
MSSHSKNHLWTSVPHPCSSVDKNQSLSPEINLNLTHVILMIRPLKSQTFTLKNANSSPQIHPQPPKNSNRIINLYRNTVNLAPMPLKTHHFTLKRLFFFRLPASAFRFEISPNQF